MSEKVIREIKIIETDEGFRIEMNGDKEELRKMLFEGGKPFFMPFGRGRGFGGHGPFGHQQREHDPREHHGHEPFGHHHDHAQHDHDPRVQDLREHLHHPFEGEQRPTPEEVQNLHFFQRRLRGGWKAKRGGYDMGPWWDEDAASDDAPPVQL